ncbi:MAG: GT2 family glycosyltransferase/glycosyltransferase involved in cell wall biosynthesis [Lysobacterales bacterium]|jgi:GT2 family glycosyltransferase/glycosyltransferase involved in cell wall biosynthesis
MQGRNSDNLDSNEHCSKAVIFVYPGDSGEPGAQWLEQLLAPGYRVFSHGDYAGCIKTQKSYLQFGSLMAELSIAAPDSPVILIRSDVQADARLIEDLAIELSIEEQITAQTVLSNAVPTVNPFAGLSGNQATAIAQISGLFELLGPGHWHNCFQWPEHFVALSPAAVSTLAGRAINSANVLAHFQLAGGSLGLSDTRFALCAGKSLFNSPRLEPHEEVRPPAWGDLSVRLQAWMDAACPAIGETWNHSKPPTLHVTHSWGGGVALWTSTFIRFDQSSSHFQLRSEGVQSGHGTGQKLSLYAANELSFPIASWWLQPPIQSLHCTNDQYRQVLDEICQRYGVGRIIVSSLVGHSLDVFLTGLPTVQVLHDHFPLWPFLSANPHSYANADGTPDISTAMEDRALLKEFSDRNAGSWQEVRNKYLDAITQSQVRVAAPGQSVIDLQRLLDPRWKNVDIELIPHGFPPFATQATVVPEPRKDKRLRIVILGRIQPGKGQNLLLEALPLLRDDAQIYLLGTGKNGESFFGISGVNVIIDYQRDELPELLSEISPDAAALLSIVPETFSYTLSELQYLGIPSIATNLGSFSGRIEQGKTGWLIDPSAIELAKLVGSLSKNRSELEKVRKNLSKHKAIEPSEMVNAYNSLCGIALGANKRSATRANLAQTQAAALAHQELNAKVARRKAEQEATALQKELRQRTDWALDSQRELSEEQKRRKYWVNLLNEESEHLKNVITSQNQKIELIDADLQIKVAALQIKDADLKKKDADLKKKDADLLIAQQLSDQILASTSWKITRPFRVLRRTTQNFVNSRAWNPLRWPVLLSGLIRNLTTVGLRGTLMRMQFGGYQVKPQPFPVDVVKSIGDTSGPDYVPSSDEPRISIIIPAYNNWVYTAACLRSIADTHASQNIEVILVDDESSDETQHKAGQIEGLKYIRNTANAGFIASCNRGAESARGEYLVMLNNDTQVLEGWLAALLDTFRQYPEAGLVGSRLVYPDGTLQESGGIIFNDGSGWNYGRNDNPERPEYLHVREVDYCSGASFMIETTLFRKLGGFSADYSPAYYEDTDLAFRVRGSGRKVLVQPASTVIHHEGITSGTDTSGGIKKFQLLNQDKFVSNWKDELAQYPSRISDPTNPAVIRTARDHRLKGRILIIDATTPEPDQDSGSLRLTFIMRCFTDLGYGVTFFADNHQHSGRYTLQLQQWGIEALYEPWLESIQSFFHQRGSEFDLVMVSRHYIAANYPSIVRKYCPNAKFIFDTVDLHYLREQRLAELENSVALRQTAKQTKRSELAVIEQSDAVLVVSETEIELLETDAPDAMVHVLSNIHEVPGRKNGFKDRKDLFFIGGFQHPPNVDAACWFVEKIWPLIKAQLPDANFHLIGSKAPESVSGLSGDGLIFHGFVQDLEPYLENCKLAVAPLRYGAGVKGKVNLSMSHGQPVVATPMAIEGIHAEHGREVLVAESEQDFANEVVRLYQDEKLWNALSDAAVENVKSHFSVEAARTSIQSLIARLKDS